MEPLDSAALGGLVHAASGALWTLGDRVLAPLAITSAQWKVLTLLARSDRTRIAQLSGALQLDQGAVSRLVARLETRGLVDRSEDPNDARASLLSLTRKGERVHARCERVLSEVMNRLLGRLPPRERAALGPALARFVHAVRLELAEPGGSKAPTRLPRRRARPVRLASPRDRRTSRRRP